jgi:hypothetical protein
MNRKTVIALLVLVLSLGTARLFADEIPPDEIIFEDPATLHIGPGAGTACAQGCGGDPNVIPNPTLGPMHVDIYQNQASAPILNQPVLLILAVPNSTNPALFSNSSITSVKSYNPYTGTSSGGVAGTWAYGNPGGPIPYYGTWNGSGYGGFFTSANSELYSFLGLQGPTDNSNNWTNLSGNSAAGTTGFGVYVFTIQGNLVGGGLIDITFATGSVPDGTFIIAYGQTAPVDKKIQIYDTPFTESGKTKQKVPEPGLLSLFALGALGLIRRRK